MTDLPDARGLVDIALQTFRAEILPVLPSNRRVDAMMIARALSIAEREMQGPADVVGPLRQLLGEEGDEDTLSRRLCAAIAEGRFDGSPALRSTLWAITRARLAVSNPRYA